jgi:hypothetical protein
MTPVYVQVPFHDVPLKRGPRTKHYSGLAKVTRTGNDYRGRPFSINALQPEAVFFFEDIEDIERFLERKSLAEILCLLKRADEAAKEPE